MNKHVYRRWLIIKEEDIGRHLLLLMSESDGTRSTILDDLRTLVRGHYVDPEVTAKRLAAMGAVKTAELLREHLPTTKRARSGDLGEILATEAEQQLGYGVPVRRLRWKDGRNMALRGDDIIGLARDKNGNLVFLKGESKSRAALSMTVLNEACSALDRDKGRPTRHSVLFVAARLRERGKDDLAQELEEAVLQSFKDATLEHMVFVFCGNNPKNLLADHLKGCGKALHRRHAVGICIKDHGKFVEDLFGGL